MKCALLIRSSFQNRLGIIQLIVWTQSDRSGFESVNKQSTPLPKPSTESAVYTLFET